MAMQPGQFQPGYPIPPSPIRPQSRTPVMIAAAVIVLLIGSGLAVIAGLSLSNNKGSASGHASLPTVPVATAHRTASARPPATLIAPTVTIPPSVPSAGRTVGSDTAPVTLDLWLDFRCPPCADFAMNIEPRLIADYVESGKVKIVYHDLTVVDMSHGGTESRDAASAARCAADQGKFAEFTPWLWANQSPDESAGAFTAQRLVAIGQAAGMDMSKFQACVTAGTHDADVEAEAQSGMSAGLASTPSALVNGVRVGNNDVVPTYEQLKAAIDAALKGSSASPAASPSAS